MFFYLKLSAEFYFNHIAVLHNVFFAFGANKAFFAGFGKTVAIEQVLPIYYFGLDEKFFKIALKERVKEEARKGIKDGLGTFIVGQFLQNLAKELEKK